MITIETIRDRSVKLDTDVYYDPDSAPTEFARGLSVALQSIIATLVEEEDRGNVTDAWCRDFLDRAQLRAEQMLRGEG